MERSDYLVECYRQLADQTFYRKLDWDPTQGLSMTLRDWCRVYSMNASLQVICVISLFQRIHALVDFIFCLSCIKWAIPVDLSFLAVVILQKIYLFTLTFSYNPLPNLYLLTLRTLRIF
ncbi:hypothetical protein HOLleu_24256 [Holothuria leucospilota]|uniref:Uncharacterized protein n=1 Tax=Holothuria leucospilota TaxID=206669 RepID=A0A9Q1H3F2_HOLLE|nr:hypothetical protein HOLleu_24256 [Holothuria leucospilota]